MVCGVCKKPIKKSYPRATASVLYWVKVHPQMGLKDCINIKFLSNSPLPIAEACFVVIQLPTIHTDRGTFFHKLDQGILYSINNYRRV